MTAKTMTAFVDYPSEWNTIRTVNSLEKITNTASLLISHPMSTIFYKKVAVRVTNTTESPYTILKKIQSAQFSVVIPEQSKFMKQVETAIPCMILEGDPDLRMYLNEILRTNKQNSRETHSVVPPETLGKTGDHTPIQIRILNELYELKAKEKFNPNDDVQSRAKSLNDLAVPELCVFSNLSISTSGFCYSLSIVLVSENNTVLP